MKNHVVKLFFMLLCLSWLNFLPLIAETESDEGIASAVFEEPCVVEESAVTEEPCVIEESDALCECFLVNRTIETNKTMESRLEIRSAAFFPLSHRFRDIYGKVGANYQLELSTRWKACHCYETWINFDWFSKHGHSIGCRNPTRIRIANASFGIKLPFRLCGPFVAYIGLGPSFAKIWLRNRSQCQCDDHVSKLAIGGVVKSGIYCMIGRCLLLDLFADYLYQPVSFHKRVDIGGVKVGVGLGVKF